MNDPSESETLLARAKSGDSDALGELMLTYRDRLVRVVRFRMDRRLNGRIDPGDVVQDAYVVAIERFPEYHHDDRMPFFLWLRFITLQKLCELHRHHLRAKVRNAAREVSLLHGPIPQATSAVLAAQLLGRITTPSQAAMRAEVKVRLEDALNDMDEIDREVVALRHFEQISNFETAKALEINESAASSRYVRAIRRLKHILDGMENASQIP
jgi:RNA polymerase sigma-70 factor (ECF subfamily)